MASIKQTNSSLSFRYRLHGGAEEIGGNFIEVEFAGKRIFLDMGMPLTLPEEGPFSSWEIEKRSTAEIVQAGYLPELPGLYNGTDPSILGIIISHPHKDHFGFIKRASPKIPIYMGEKTRAIIEATAHFIKDYPTFKENILHPISDRARFQLGPFEITPFASDHSAFDSYSLLIRVGGKSLFYSGDLRAHGRKGYFFESLLRDIPRSIDHFLLEGTMMGRPREKRLREVDLANDFTGLLTSRRGLVLVNTSAHNIDRLETIYYSAMNAGRTLIMDNYSAYIYTAIGHPFLPGKAPEVRVFFPVRQCINIKKEATFSTKLTPFMDRRIYADEIAKSPEKYVMLFRDSMLEDFSDRGRRYIPTKCLAGAKHIYSMWDGYWDEMPRTQAFLREHRIRNVAIHCSGHAYKQDLKRLLAAAQPQYAVPIHTEKERRKDFKGIYSSVLPVNKGEWQRI
ncbi:MAG: hypothetical protein A2089_03870 [Elusimicrobia bacterium GWD2_63_28]|nr:MAG: hypothetical protein A2089_03870 [Elusimicrobia bacterium GWD2_63_28]